MAAYGRLQDGCGCPSSALFCNYELLHLSSIFVRHSQKLKLRSIISSALLSSPAFSQPISINPLSREKTCLEFASLSLTSYRTTERWVCFAGGGKRPRRPHIWKSRHRRGSYSKSDKLLALLEPVSNVKEEVYGVLDGFIAWELDFPLIAVKKALWTLEKEQNWARIIQIIKWMLGKGQGRSLGTYHLLLKAFCEENRTDEAQELFRKVFSRNFECTPLKLFSEIMRLYERHEMYEDILEVFADMEELNVRLDAGLSGIVSRTYEKIGDMDRAQRVTLKYGAPKFRWRTIGGRAIKFRNEDRDVASSIWRRNGDSDQQNESDSAVSRWTADDKSDYEGVESETDESGYLSVGDEDEMVASQEDSREYGSAGDKDFEVEEDKGRGDEDEDRGDEDELAHEIYNRHFHAMQTSGNEMYV